MATLTIRTDEQTAEELSSEYEEHGFESKSEYLRHILDNREIIMDGAPGESTVKERLDQMEAEIEDLKATIRTLEGPASPVSAPSGPSPSIESQPESEAGERVQSVDELDLPGSGETLEARQEALQAVYDRLQELGSATKQELLEPVDPDAVGYQDRRSFWSNVIGGRDTLSRLPGVEPPKAGGRTWRYVED